MQRAVWYVAADKTVQMFPGPKFTFEFNEDKLDVQTGMWTCDGADVPRQYQQHTSSRKCCKGKSNEGIASPQGLTKDKN